MAITDRSGLPIAVNVASATPHEIKLVESTLEQSWLLSTLPERLKGASALLPTLESGAFICLAV